VSNSNWWSWNHMGQPQNIEIEAIFLKLGLKIARVLVSVRSDKKKKTNGPFLFW